MSRVLETPESSTLAAGLPVTFFVITTPSRLFTVFTCNLVDAGSREERAIQKRRLHMFSATVLIAAIRVWFIKLGVGSSYRLSSLFTYSLLQLSFACLSVCRKSCVKERWLTLVNIGPQSTTKCLPSELSDYLLSLCYRLLRPLNERERRKQLLDHEGFQASQAHLMEFSERNSIAFSMSFPNYSLREKGLKLRSRKKKGNEKGVVSDIYGYYHLDTLLARPHRGRRVCSFLLSLLADLR